MFPLSTLSAPVVGSLESIIRKSTDGFVGNFSDDIVLNDEGKSQTGLEALRKWHDEALIGHRATIDIQSGVTLREHTIVDLIMDGDFEADYNITDPITLYFDFTVLNNIITALTITSHDPIMNAVSISTPNDKDPISAIHLSRQPQKPAPEGWVKVKLQAVGLNYHDIFTMRGFISQSVTEPLVLGCEGTGTLSDGTEVLIYPLMGDPNFKGDETLDPQRHVFSEKVDGTLAEYINVPKRNIIVKPKEVSTEAAAVMGIAWLTAYRMLFTKSGLRAGQKMLVQGSSGGVTTALIQLGSAAGMRVWCTGRTAAKRELGLKLGAEKAFESGETLPEKADAVFDTSGEVTWKHSINSVKTGGTVVTCGGHSGQFIPMEVSHVFVEQLTVKGSYLGTLEEFKDLIAFLVSKSIKPHIGIVLPMARAADGFRMMFEGKTNGKVVVTM
ncbi:NAD(P)-binding protein [Cadophora sp. DSE1049]|nr:NAD(P)-binding protein [Cadophora sp. DSE1049]